MNNQVLFTEKQRFKQWWLWILLFGINGLFLFGAVKQVFMGQPFGDKPASSVVLLIVTGFTLLLSALFFSCRLHTVIKRDGIYVRLLPWQSKFKFYGWETITKSYIRKYAAIKEYGGWGSRAAFFGKGMAFNVSGNMGLQLEFTKGEPLLIGTNKPDELSQALQAIGQIKP